MKTVHVLSLFFLARSAIVGGFSTTSNGFGDPTRRSSHHRLLKDDNIDTKIAESSTRPAGDLGKKVTTALVGGLFMASTIFGQPNFSAAADTAQKYDGFADYAKENKMEQSDVGCFINKCGDQTKDLFANPRGKN